MKSLRLLRTTSRRNTGGVEVVVWTVYQHFDPKRTEESSRQSREKQPNRAREDAGCVLLVLPIKTLGRAKSMSILFASQPIPHTPSLPKIIF